MNITELIEELELEACMASDMENAKPEDGRLSMEAAGTLRRLFEALKPFAEAADIVDVKSDEQLGLLGSSISPNASPGWGIKRHHLDTARVALWEKAEATGPQVCAKCSISLAKYHALGSSGETDGSASLVIGVEILSRALMSKDDAEKFREQSKQVVLRDTETGAHVVCYHHPDGTVLVDSIRLPDRLNPDTTP